MSRYCVSKAGSVLTQKSSEKFGDTGYIQDLMDDCDQNSKNQKADTNIDSKALTQDISVGTKLQWHLE